jgi:hypothetical protein
MLFAPPDAVRTMENPLALGAGHLPEFTGQEPPHLAWCKKLAQIILTVRL